jgi:hypothetical protein
MLGWTLVGTAAFDRPLCFLREHVTPQWAQYFKYGCIWRSTFNVQLANNVASRCVRAELQAFPFASPIIPDKQCPIQ